MSAAERKLIERFRHLPSRARAGVLRILETIEEGADPEDIDFDLWARALVRRKGILPVRESDVLRAVRRIRTS